LKIYEKNKYLNSTITPTFENTPLSSESIIYNVPYSLKDLFCTKDIKTTGGSKFYKNFTPNYSSTVYEMLSRNGGYLVGKDTCDEFGCGGSGFECSAIGDIPVINFHNEKKVVLGSCSGSANKVASSEVIFSIGVDTCDSVRHPASLVGIVGYKPTYGLISRYGTFSFCNTMDTVGILAQNVSDAGIIANILIRYDEKDMTSQIICTKDEKVNRNGIIQTSEKKIKVGIIKFNDEQ
jgi:aspartyl-tRNA(Asn)/glutamyl-tRNA(Gln) amidotransferase subunit A